MRENLMLFTLHSVFANLFLKPGHVHGFQDVDTECIQRVFGRMGIAGVSCLYHLLLYSVVSP